MKKYHIETHGCQMNVHDSERISGLLDADGMIETTDLNEADVIVLNTCCIRENADNRLYGQLGHMKALKDERPDVQIVVAGCLAQKDKDLVREKAPHVDVVFGTHNVARAAELIHESELAGPITEILEESDAFPSALPVKRDLPYAAWVTIQIGCDNNCAFCIVPTVRGREISRPFGEVVAEVQRLADSGVTEVTLLGQNVNSYGRDLTLAARGQSDTSYQTGEKWASEKSRVRPLFADLLRAVAAVPGIARVRYTSPHPKDMREDVFLAMAETPEICNHLHFPLQSGSDRVLAAMHRGYTAKRYLEKLALAREMIPDLAVTTDIIIGFPGETDEDFAHTLEVAVEANFDSAYTFLYSPRTGTEAATMTDAFISGELMGQRYERLDAVVQRTALEKHRGRVDRIEAVMVEGPSRKDPSLLTGRTAQNKLVHFISPVQLREGAYANVRVTYGAPHHLMGEFVEALAPPRHKIRIPLAVSA